MRVVWGPESYGLSGAIVAARYIFTSRFFVNSAVVQPFDNGFAQNSGPKQSDEIAAKRINRRNTNLETLFSTIIISVFEAY